MIQRYYNFSELLFMKGSQLMKDMTIIIWQGPKRNCGGAGYRSRYLSHAKRALYHLSYAPSSC